MLKNRLIILSFFLVSIGFSQELSFSSFGGSPAYCRTAGDQNGNGTVYGAATGGVPSYTYVWTDLATGDMYSGTVWSGRNVGCYKLQVTDAAGTIITDVVCIDSINPIANMAIISDDVEGGPFYFDGAAPAAVVFDNLSANVPDPVGPDAEIRYYFKPQGLAPAETATNLATNFYYTYEYAGIWTASLVAKNKNGCTDTVAVTFYIDGPSTLNEMIPTAEISILTNPAQSQLKVIIPTIEQGQFFQIYDISGQLMLTQPLTAAETTISFLYPKGIYFYQFIDQTGGNVLESGKINF